MSYDNFATTFSNSRKNHPWPELEYIIGDIKDHKLSSVLDIGCGNGRFIEEAQKLDFTPSKYLGTDSSALMIEEAKKLHPNNEFQVIWMEDIHTLGEESFDAIVLLASFHHLEKRADRVQVLEKMRELMTPDSRIYLTNWNLLEQERYQALHRGNGDFDIKIGEFTRYYHGFTLDELGELFEQTGYNIIENRVFDGGRNILSILSQ